MFQCFGLFLCIDMGMGQSMGKGIDMGVCFGHETKNFFHKKNPVPKLWIGESAKQMYL